MNADRNYNCFVLVSFFISIRLKNSQLTSEESGFTLVCPYHYIVNCDLIWDAVSAYYFVLCFEHFLIVFNPFTAPACKISGLKDEWMRLQKSMFSNPITHLLSMLYIVMKILLHVSGKKKTKRLKGLRFLTFIGSFQVTYWQWRG